MRVDFWIDQSSPLSPLFANCSWTLIHDAHFLRMMFHSQLRLSSQNRNSVRSPGKMSRPSLECWDYWKFKTQVLKHAVMTVIGNPEILWDLYKPWRDGGNPCSSSKRYSNGTTGSRSSIIKYQRSNSNLNCYSSHIPFKATLFSVSQEASRTDSDGASIMEPVFLSSHTLPL